MKVLQFCPQKLPLINSSKRIFGGGEKSCIEIARALSNAGIEVDSIVNPETFTDYVPGNCIAINTRKVSEIAAVINNKKYDLVIFHMIGQSGLNALTKLGIPTTMIWHLQLNILGISKFGMFQAMEKNRKIGGKLVGVSNTIKNRLNVEFKKTYDWCLQKGEKYKDYTDVCENLQCDEGFTFQYVDDSERVSVKESNKKPVLISQLTKVRYPKVVIEELRNECDYFVSYKDEYDPYVKSILKLNLDSAFYNGPHFDIMERLRSYKVLINPSIGETAGYGVFEAATFGIPSILFNAEGDQNSAVEFFKEGQYKQIVLPTKKKMMNSIFSDLKTLINDTPESLEFRESIQDHIFSTFTADKVVKFLTKDVK